MQPRERVLRRIEQVLELEASPEVAYPLRARLARAMNEAANYLRGEGCDPRIVASLTQRAMRIMQPSEPFDGVWQGEWASATRDLRNLRELVSRCE